MNMYEFYMKPIRRFLRANRKNKFYEAFYNIGPYYEKFGICPHCMSLVYGEVHCYGEIELNKDINQTVIHAPPHIYRDFFWRDYYCQLKDTAIDKLGVVHKKDCGLYKHFKKSKLARYIYSYMPSWVLSNFGKEVQCEN